MLRGLPCNMSMRGLQSMADSSMCDRKPSYLLSSLQSSIHTGYYDTKCSIHSAATSAIIKAHQFPPSRVSPGDEDGSQLAGLVMAVTPPGPPAEKPA
ncbi:Hypp4354 [Branchiostoma lanceolatum]|uniref:Hypp4354 protein n=1 Tax=Branchiostoma lanceolatum TaxID=7740 RepID=A0A8K0A8C9_BRALA|nr:Hypp4354 [Branchiostoma lanceolatum]